MVRYNRDEWIEADYVDRNDQGRITCLLCHAGPMIGRSIEDHFYGQRHLGTIRFHLQVDLLSDEYIQKLRLDEVRLFKPRIEAIEFEPWKQHVQSLFFTAITNPASQKSHSQAFDQFYKYERMEALSLLELAIIKTEFHEYQASVESDIDRRTFWDNRKTTSGSNVIVPLVMEFLTEETYECWFISNTSL